MKRRSIDAVLSKPNESGAREIDFLQRALGYLKVNDVVLKPGGISEGKVRVWVMNHACGHIRP